MSTRRVAAPTAGRRRRAGRAGASCSCPRTRTTPPRSNVAAARLRWLLLRRGSSSGMGYAFRCSSAICPGLCRKRWPGPKVEVPEADHSSIRCQLLENSWGQGGARRARGGLWTPASGPAGEPAEGRSGSRTATRASPGMRSRPPGASVSTRQNVPVRADASISAPWWRSRTAPNRPKMQFVACSPSRISSRTSPSAEITVTPWETVVATNSRPSAANAMPSGTCSSESWQNVTGSPFSIRRTRCAIDSVQ